MDTLRDMGAPIDIQNVFVDLAFRVHGESVPLDHGYALFSALCQEIDTLHDNPVWGVHPLRGLRSGLDTLRLTRVSRLRLRLPACEIARALPLAGKELRVGANSRLRVGTPDVQLLEPTATLRARLVTIKGFAGDATDFAASARQQLLTMTDGTATHASIAVGQRRVVRIHEYVVVGFAVTLSNLDAATSVRVQEIGIGGKRRMGCGMFVPPPRPKSKLKSRPPGDPPDDSMGDNGREDQPR